MTTDDLRNALEFAAETEHEGDQRVCFAQAKAACRTLAKEIERLQAIVDNIPKLVVLAGCDAIVNYMKHGHEMTEQDCLPSLYKRGDSWRYHRRVAGNEWADEADPLTAAEKARK